MPTVDPPRNTLVEAFEAAADALSALQVPYALIGGLAVAVHGLPRATGDIDLLWSLPRVALPGVLESFRNRGFTMDIDQVIRELGQDHLSQLSFRGARVDLLDAVLPLFRGVVDRAQEATVFGKQVRVAGAADLVTLKILAGRERDVTDVRGILAVQGPSLDLNAIRRALDECGGQEHLALLERLSQEPR